jgi:asparagine synthase (glutamine-hydrolysing)
MISDVPLGAFLSGGIDSSLVVSIMQEISSTPVKTYTIGFNNEDYDEAYTAKLTAETLGTDHTEHYFEEKNAYSIVPELSSIYDEPFADASQIPTILVSKLAKQDVTVALTGDGGDELMGGYSRHLFANKLWGFNKKIPAGLRNLIPSDTIANQENAIQKMYEFINRIGLKSKNYRQFGNKVTKAVSALTATDQKDLYSTLLKNKLDEEELFSVSSLKLTRDGNAFNFGNIADTENPMLKKMMYWDAKNYMMDDVLVKVDRATMSTSLEARSPLLDYHLFEYVWSLPTEYMVSNKNGGKLLMKSLLEEYLPEEILNQPKSGFTIPIGQWLKGPLRSWAEGLIFSNNGSYKYINKNYVRRIWQKHLKGKGNWVDELWTILMFLAWYKEHLS